MIIKLTVSGEPIAKQRARELMESGFIKRDKRPDYDNISKAVSDALNGLAYSDDGQIVSASIEKLYSGRPRLEIELEKTELGTDKHRGEAKEGSG
jgi:Holliday junction resolvase RusA-like endonuclease